MLEILEKIKVLEEKYSERYKKIDDIAFKNQLRVMEAFRKHRVSDAMFTLSSGYGYGDLGRDTADLLYAEVFECESAFVRHNIVSGTHALTIALFGLLRPGDKLLSVGGKPYDTLDEVIGISGEAGNGSLRDFGVEYDQTELVDGAFDYKAIKEKLTPNTKVVYIQRSKGYSVRKTLSSAEIGELVKFVKGMSDAFVVVDNCYGEFVELHEPTYYGADICVGSLIKNPGGGMAESGGYIAGTAKAVELCAYRLTSPGIGLECGASLGQSKSIIKGLFYAPHTTAQALKTALIAAGLFSDMGFKVSPTPEEDRYDIIQTVSLDSPEQICAFCRGIQKGSPIDSHVTPEPWDMPGYSSQVIMAAGTFVQGASIELSADAPIREPYTVYFQGGLTYESGKIGLVEAVKAVMEEMKN
ncbi:MAG: methionine gamma-lyase family protein [Clostridia bacterium]|nr:methionine gamma-lyase family protein [Clostridia bacterium]